ncbi:MAG: oligosaccharide flippase family protein [Chthoniobacterales bacterium]|nr:oligosaccharide flippase family protein [Chthoniobacterales bacterium]
MLDPKIRSATNHAPAQGAVLARGAFFSTLAFLASNLRAIFMLLVARLLGSAVLGTFGLAWAAMDLLSKFATLGLDYSAIAFVAKTEAAHDPVGSRRVMRAALAISVGSGIGLALVAAVLVWIFGPRFGLRPELARAASVMMLAIPGLALYRVSNALSRGMAVMHHEIYSHGFTESLGTAAALLGALALGIRDLAPEVAAIAGTLASGLVAFFLARRLFASASRAAPRQEGDALVRKLVQASAPIALYDLLNLGVMHIDVIMLGWFVGRAPGVTLETLGIYAAAVQLVGGLRKVGGVFVPIFTPVVARQISSGQMRAAEESYGYLARWMLAILLPALIVLALAGGGIMTIFGAAFYGGGTWVPIIGAACAMNAFVGLGETILMIERPGINLFNSTIAFVSAVGLNLIFIPAFGPLGAALGMLVPYSIQGVLRGVEISWLLKWRWPWRALLKPWLAALIPLPIALVARLFARGIIWEFAAAGLYLAGYLLAWRVIGLERGDRDVLDHLFARSQPNHPQCEKVNMQ